MLYNKKNDFYFHLICLFQDCQRTCKYGGIPIRLNNIDYCVCHKNYFGNECGTELSKLNAKQKQQLGCALKPCWFGSTCEDLTHLPGGTFRCHCSAVII